MTIVIASHGSVTNSPQQTISGTYVPEIINSQYSFVRIQDGADGGFYNIGDVQPDLKSGHWSIGVTLGGIARSPTPGGGFSQGVEGDHSIVAQAIAPNGSVLESSAPVLYTLKRTAPVLTFASVPAAINNPALAVSGTIDTPGLVVSIIDGGLPLADVSSDSGGQWNARITLSGAGPHTLLAAATDLAGNRGESARVHTVLSTAAPTLTITGITATGTQSIHTVRGTIDTTDASLQVNVFDGPDLRATVPTQNMGTNGAWSVDIVLAPGAHSLSAKATNAAGTGASAPFPISVAQGG